MSINQQSDCGSLYQDDASTEALVRSCARIVMSLPLYKASEFQIQELKRCAHDLDDLIGQHTKLACTSIGFSGSRQAHHSLHSMRDSDCAQPCTEIAGIEMRTLRLLQCMLQSRLACEGLECSNNRHHKDGSANFHRNDDGGNGSLNPRALVRISGEADYDHGTWLRGSDVTNSLRRSLQSKIQSVERAASISSDLNHTKVMTDTVNHVNADVLQERQISFRKFIASLRQRGEQHIRAMRNNNEAVLFQQQSAVNDDERLQRMCFAKSIFGCQMVTKIL